ncbi:MAG: DUF1206 domain-containing protein [Verrucomicrobiales bacterium]|nr:DUF1206 domain-containing protein [Verrucomicrobiales bacterium]
MTAFNLVATGSDEGSSPGRYISELMGSIWGIVLLSLVATGILAASFTQATKAITGSFKERYHIDDLPSKVSKFVGVSGFLGLSARAFIFATLSLFLLYALLTRDSSQAESMSGALQWLDSSTAGPWVLATMGIGFTAYGIYAAALSRYGTIHRN